MGFHVCEYCQKSGEAKPATSSGDVTLSFSSGRKYVVPDMITHYVEKHEFQPPEQFISDVIDSEFTGGDRRQTRSVMQAEPVGYLAGEYQHGAVPASFLEKLKRVIELAAGLGGRAQTKSLDGDTVYRGETE